MSLEDPVATLDRPPTTPGWRTAPTTSPAAATRSRACIVQLNGVYWMIAGCRDAADLSSTDCLTWTSVPTYSPQTPGNTGAVFGGYLMLYGGMRAGPPPPLASSDGYSRTPGAPYPQGYWHKFETAPWPGRREHMMAVFDDKLWVIGGATMSYNWYADAWYVSTNSPGWQNDNTWAGPARGLTGVAVYRDELWVIGGKTNDPYVGWLGTAAVKPRGRAWEVRTIAPNFAPRYGAQAQVVGDKLYVFGGSGSSGGLTDMWCYDGQTWTQLADACPWGGDLADYCSTVKDGEVYVLSGFGNGGGNANIYIYNPA